MYNPLEHRALPRAGLSANLLGQTRTESGVLCMEEHKGEVRMATQLAETPTLFGEDAKAVLDEIKHVPSKEEIKRLEDRLAKQFEGVKKRGIR